MTDAIIDDRSRDAFERRFRAVTSSVNDAIVAADAQSRIVFVNPAAVRLFGRPEDELVGSSLTTLMPERYREAHHAGLAHLLATDEPRLVGRATVELEALRADGSEVPIELSLGQWTEDDGTRWFTGVVRDISERREAERHVRAQHAVTRVLAEAATTAEAAPRLLEALGSEMGWVVGGLWRIDPADGRLRCTTTWSAPGYDAAEFVAVTRSTALAPGEGIPGRTWASGRAAWVLDLAGEMHSSRAPSALATGLQAAIGLPIEGGDEPLGVLEFFTSTLREPDDAVLASMAALGDRIGQFFRRREAEEALAEAQSELERRAQELERSNGDLEQFAYVASHDLSEPLRTVTGFAQLLQRRYEGRLDADADVWIDHLVGGTSRMQALIDDLLAYARVGSAPREPAPVDLGAVVGEVLAGLDATIRASGAHVDVGPLPTVPGDAPQLRQLLQNLIANALKFHGDAPPEVAATAEREGDAWRLAVADRGIGIADNMLDSIFAMFRRLNSREVVYEGTGIGLALCRRIAENHGGTIAARAREGGGTVFEVVLPAG